LRKDECPVDDGFVDDGHAAARCFARITLKFLRKQLELTLRGAKVRDAYDGQPPDADAAEAAAAAATTA